jgi:hypothetical protein
MTIQMKENPGVVETIIDLLNHIEVDGETMQYILKNVGMEDQMLKQLMGTTSMERWIDLFEMRKEF